MKCLITRTVPWPDFSEILRRHFNEDSGERVLWVQKSVSSQNLDSKKYRTVIVADGPFIFTALDTEFLEKLKQEKFQKLILPTNNMQFLGYDDFFKLGVALKVESILMITKDGQERKFSLIQAKKRLFFLKLKEIQSFTVPLTVEFLKTGITLILVLFVLPMAFLLYHLRFAFDHPSNIKT